MKKANCASAGISFGITLLLTAINFLTAYTMEYPLIALKMAGGEVIDWLGVGIYYERFYPLMDNSNPIEYTPYEVHFYLLSFLLCWLLLFLIVRLIIRIVRKKAEGSKQDIRLNKKASLIKMIS